MNVKNNYLLDFPEIVIVEASAGTGKTRELAKRYLQLLLSPSCRGRARLDNILATTFTNKAAFEMKERILDFLKKISLGLLSDEEEDIMRIIGMEKDKARERASSIMDEIIKHYSFFQVQTIDSLINSFLLSSALNIERSAEFKIKKDQNQYLKYCFDKIIDEAEKDKILFGIFEEFLKHYLFVENRTSWFPKQDILDLMKFLFSLYNKYGINFHISSLSNEDILKHKTILYKKIGKIYSEVPEGLNKTAIKSISRFLKTQSGHFSIKTLPDIFRNSTPPMNKGKNVSESFMKEWEDIAENAEKLALLESRISFNPYIKLFMRVLKELKRASKRDDILFLEELNNKTHVLLGSGISLPELYYRMSMRLSHYLIDEFQDTSILQWNNLKEMIEDALSSGGTLFCVGDKKQEIYRFRGGETKLFNNIRTKWQRYYVKNRMLKKNWRSHKAIVEFNNKVFSLDNLRGAFSKISVLNNENIDTEDILKTFMASTQEYDGKNNLGYVHTEIIEAKNQKERNGIISSKLIGLIRSLEKRTFTYKNIAILCRDNSEIELITSWLLKENIPVESEKTLDLKENSLIKEIISVLKFLDSPIDNISFISFILGDIFSKATGLSKEVVTDFIFNMHKNGTLSTVTAVYRVFRAEYPTIWNRYIDKFFKSVGFLSPYELVVSIYDTFKVADNFKENQSFFMKLLELIKNKEDEYTGLDDFLYYLDIAPKEDLYVAVTEANSVRLLTIHKSKGLEFGVVIIPFMRIQPKPEEGMNSFVRLQDDGSLELLRITKEHIKYSDTLKAVYKDAYTKSLADELNTMYVAFTRAKLELYVFIPDKVGNSFNKVRFFTDGIPNCWGDQSSYTVEEKTHVIKQISVYHSQNWIDFLKDDVLEETSFKNRDKILEGEIMHFILSRIGNLYAENNTMIINNAISAAKAKYPHSDNFSYAQDKITDIISSKLTKPFFYAEKGRIYTEKEIVDAKGRTCRIDRIVVLDKEVWIIDYKTSCAAKEKHFTQINEYAEVLKTVYPGKEIKGFLLYMDKIEIEKV